MNYPENSTDPVGDVQRDGLRTGTPSYGRWTEMIRRLQDIDGRRADVQEPVAQLRGVPTADEGGRDNVYKVKVKASEASAAGVIEVTVTDEDEPGKPTLKDQASAAGWERGLEAERGSRTRTLTWTDEKWQWARWSMDMQTWDGHRQGDVGVPQSPRWRMI